MKLLLDECVTRYVKRDLMRHEVHTIEQVGFKGLKNGALLAAASGIYDALITVDQNVPHQLNLSGFPIAILILAARSNAYARLQPTMAQAVVALQSIKPGEVVRIEECKPPPA